jgi:hypothetical protein
MNIVGHVDSLWRYPVKSMRGEELQESFVGFSGIYGDRLYAFRSSAAPKGFPYLTGREQGKLLLYRPRYRHPENMAKPSNLAEAEAMSPGLTPVYASPADLGVDVETPSGELLPIDDPRLINKVREGIRDVRDLTLLRSDRAMTDCRPISLFSLQTVRKLSEELGSDLDKRRSEMAQPVFPLDDAPRPEDCQGRHGAETRDLCTGCGARDGITTSCKVRFARGQARNRRWCAVEHREIDWAARSSSQRSSK